MAKSNQVDCIFCDIPLVHDHDRGHYKCPDCGGTWVPGNKPLLWRHYPGTAQLTCPVAGCGKTYIYNKVNGYYECPSCRSAFFPPEPPPMDESEDNPEWIEGKSLWENEQAYKKRISKPGGSSESKKKRKKNMQLHTTDRYKLE